MLIGLDDRMDGIEDKHQGAPVRGTRRCGYQRGFLLYNKNALRYRLNIVCGLVLGVNVWHLMGRGTYTHVSVLSSLILFQFWTIISCFLVPPQGLFYVSDLM